MCLAETDHVVARGDDGKLYQLKKSGLRKANYSWVAAPKGLTDQPEFNRDVQMTPGGEIKVGADLRVQINDGGWSPANLRSPPDGFTQPHVTTDINGNLYIQLGGKGTGFNFEDTNGTFQLANKMTFSQYLPVGEIKKMVGNPHSDGAYVLTNDGQVLLVRQESYGSSQFEVENMNIMEATEIVVANDMVVVMDKSGDSLIKVKEDGDFAKIATPDDFKSGPTAKVYSTFQPKLKEQINADAMAAVVAQTPAQTTSTAARARRVPDAIVHGDTKAALPAGWGELLPDGHKLKWDEKADKWVRVKLADPNDPKSKDEVVEPPVDNLANAVKKAGSKEASEFLAAITRNMSHDEASDEYVGHRTEYFGRDYEADKIMEMLIRQKGANPTLVGEAGVGKTAIAELLAQKIFYGDIPDARRFDFDVRGALMLETSADQIAQFAKSDSGNAQAEAMRNFVKGMKQVQEALGKPVLLFIDEAHMLSKDQFNALKPILESRRSPIRVILSTTDREYGLWVQRDTAMERRAPRVDILEFDKEKTRELLKKTVVPVLEKYYAGYEGGDAVITDHAIEQVLERSKEVAPDIAFPEAPIKLLIDVATREHRLAGHKSPVIDGEQVGAFVKDEMKLLFDPTDPEFDVKLDGVKDELAHEVVDQRRMTDLVVDSFRAAVEGEGTKNHRIILVNGTTGSGKSHGAEAAAKRLVGESRTLTIDGTKYANAGSNLNIIMNDLLGAPPGIISSDETRGILPEFLSGPGRGVNFIIINEADKMDPDALKRLMEMFDTGVLQASDGRNYRLGRSVVILTTNKGSEQIYSRRFGKGMTRDELEHRAASFSSDDIKGMFLKPDPNDQYDQGNKRVPPEVIQRIDAAVAVIPPSDEGASKILRNEMEKKSASVYDAKRYHVDVSDDVIDSVRRAKYDPENGVREPIRALMSVFEQARSELRKKGGAITKDDTIKIELIPGNLETPDRYRVYRESNPSEFVELDSPDMSAVEDPLQDPIKRKKLLGLEDNMSKHVFGQKHMVDQTAEFIRNQWANPALETPVSLLLMGTTGTGKTELSKAIARELFDSEYRALILPMGDVQHEMDFNNIFNPPKGIVGSGQMSEFEQFLSANKEFGGVVVLDEIGNMGGGDPRKKSELLKKFYKILDEGTWTNPVTGETYDLRKFIFVLTTNEGQELFAGQPADDLRETTWEAAKGRDVLDEILKQSHGWPEALVGRVDNVILAKPLDKASRSLVANKFIDSLESQIKGVTHIDGIEVAPEFLDLFGETFFSHEQGARMMRRQIQKGAVSSLITAARTQLERGELRGATLEFQMSDNFAGRHSYADQEGMPEREVKIRLIVKKDGKEVGSFESPNIADKAAEKKLMSESYQQMVALHEAGHVIGNDPTKTGTKTVHVTIQGAGKYGGYARSNQPDPSIIPDREMMVARIARLLAAQEAVKLAGLNPNAGWSQDINQALEIAEKTVGEYRLVENPWSLPTTVTKDGNRVVDIHSKEAQQEIAKLMTEGEKVAKERITANWGEVLSLSQALLDNSFLNEQGIDEARERGKPIGAWTADNAKALCNGSFQSLIGG